MPKSKKPAPKGGKKVAAPKKVAKRAPAKSARDMAKAIQKMPGATKPEIIAAFGDVKPLTARQADQIVADRMRVEAYVAANKQPQAMTDTTATLPLHPTVEEQFEAEVAAFEAAYRAKVMQPTTTAPPKKSMWARFRSAVTGLFVSKKFAQANPDTTVREKVE